MDPLRVGGGDSKPRQCNGSPQPCNSMVHSQPTFIFISEGQIIGGWGVPPARGGRCLTSPNQGPSWCRFCHCRSVHTQTQKPAIVEKECMHKGRSGFTCFTGLVPKFEGQRDGAGGGWGFVRQSSDQPTSCLTWKQNQANMDLSATGTLSMPRHKGLRLTSHT